MVNQIQNISKEENCSNRQPSFNKATAIKTLWYICEVSKPSKDTEFWNKFLKYADSVYVLHALAFLQ